LKGNMTGSLESSLPVHCARVIVASFLALAFSLTAGDDKPIRVLIVTGIDYPGHQWQKTTPVLQEELTKDPRMKVEVLDSPYKLEGADLSDTDVLLLHFMNWEKPDPNDAAKENLRSFVERGGGLVSVHFACGAFGGWPEYAALIGRVWDRTNTHDPRGIFRVDIINTNHAVTRGMESFETDDELYTCLTGIKPVEFLATARSKVDKRDHPMAFVHTYGEGRVFLTPLGHDVKALRAPGTAELIRRGAAWAAGREPLPPRKAEAPAPDPGQVESGFRSSPGYSVQLVAAEPHLANPMSIAVDEDGVLWVTEAHTYRWGPKESPYQPPNNPIKRIELGPGGRAQRTIVAAEGFAEPVIGIAAREGQVFVTCLNELLVFDVAPDGRLANRRLLVKDAATPWNPFGFYRVHVGPDDKLWLAIADHPGGEPVLLTGSDGRRIRLNGKSGGLVRCNRDGSGLEIMVHGFRAPYAFDIDPWGHIWHVSNGEGSPNLYLHVIPGLDYGYASRKVSYAWLAGEEPLAPPVRDMGAGANTAALHYYSSMFPREDWGTVFIANWGNHGANPPNRDIHRYRRGTTGERIGTSDAELVLLDRWLWTVEPMFRPTGLAYAPDGGLYLIDWHGVDDENNRKGRVLKMASSGEQDRQQTLPSRDEIAGRDPRGLARLLGHRNHVVREQVIRALVRQGAEAIGVLRVAVERGEPFAAAQAVWALSRMETTAAAQALSRGLNHPDARVRAHALRQLRQAAGQKIGGENLGVLEAGSGMSSSLLPAIELARITAPLLNDPDAEVRVEAALAQNSPAAVTRGLASALNAQPDRRLVYQIALEFSRRGDPATIQELLASPDPERRRVALIALENSRHERTPLAEAFDAFAPDALQRLIAANFAQKLEWLRRVRPEEFAAELGRLDRGEVTLASAGEKIAALETLRGMPPALMPRKFLRACLEGSEGSVQIGALQVLRQLPRSTELSDAVLKLARQSSSKEVTFEALFTLAGLDGVSAAQWSALLQNPADERVIAGLRALRHGEPASEMTASLAELNSILGGRTEAVREELRLTLALLEADGEQGKRSPAFPAESKGELARRVLALLPKASPTLGRLAFHSQKTGCAACHANRLGESRLGPALTELAAVSDPAVLIESILDPSRVIKTGYEVEEIEMADGESFSGLVEVRGENLGITRGAGEQIVVPRSAVKTRTPTRVSLMPEGLETSMTPRELADVVAYLASLRFTEKSPDGGAATKLTNHE
jgi:uncharacterized protein